MAALASWAIEEPAISHSASFEIDEEAEVAVESDDLRNRIDASAVNQYDLMMISGNYGYRPHLPAIMGTEGVGRSIAVGNAVNDAVEQAPSKTSLAELVHGVG